MGSVILSQSQIDTSTPHQVVLLSSAVLSEAYFARPTLSAFVSVQILLLSLLSFSGMPRHDTPNSAG